VLDGGRLGEVDTHVDVIYNMSHEGNARGKVEQSLEIPVRGWVDYGEFEPSEPVIRIVQIDDDTQTISFTNTFPAPVVVIAARIEDPSFRVVGFIPFIVPAGSRSKEIRFKFTRRPIATYFETVLIVDTNATIRRVPIYCYTGQVTISKTSTSDPSSNLFFCFGKTLCNSGVNVSIWVHNPNPTDCLLTDFNVSAGLQVSAFWAGDEASGLRNHRLPQFSTERLDVQIVFKTIAGMSPRNDSISFGGLGSISHIVVSWIPHAGSFTVSTSLTGTAVLGNWYNATVFINSSYGVGRRVFGAVSYQEWLAVRPLPAYIRPRILTAVATVDFVFSPEHVNGLVLGDIHNSTHQLQVWSEFWRRPHSLTMGFLLQLKGSSSMRIAFKIAVEPSAYENIILDAGFILPGVNYPQVFQITNKHDCAVEFYSPSFSTVALPRQLLSIPLILNAGGIGYFSHDLPVTTNMTPPFFVNISGFAVPPMIRFIGDDRADLTELVFDAGSWRRVAFVWNVGQCEVGLGAVASPAREIHIASNCSDSLAVGSSCAVEFSVDVRLVDCAEEVVEFVLEASGSVNILPLRVVLGSEAVERMRRLRLLKFVGASIVLSGLTIGRVIGSVCGCWMNRRDMRRRARELASGTKTVKKTVIARAVAVQVDPVREGAITGGVWVPAREAQINATSAALECMQEFIAKVNNR
jgi:hypothetical protein